MMQPQPLPTEIRLGMARSSEDGSAMVTLEVSTPQGVAVYFIEPEVAEQLGEQLTQVGRESGGKLVTATPRLVVPGQ